MKKSILTLLVLFVCTIQTTTAYEYFTIYFSDGTKSEAFYATDVDSICYSKLSLDSIAYDDWQVQEVWINGYANRYLLASIDSISFTTILDEELVSNISTATSEIGSIFIESESADELYEKIASTIPKEVDSVWVKGRTLFVKIEGWNPISFTYPLRGDSELDNRIDDLLASTALTRRASNKSNDNKAHYYLDAKKAVVVNQPFYDEDPKRNRYKSVASTLYSSFNKLGKIVISTTNLLLNFLIRKSLIMTW